MRIQSARKALGLSVVAVGLAAGATGAVAQTGEVVIPAGDVARVVNGLLTDARVRLDNRGDWTGGSYYDPNGSSLRMFGSADPIVLPPIHKTIAQTKYMYYANDIRSEAVVFQRENGGYIVKIPFESGGTEIKGLCRKRRGLGKKRHWGECRWKRGNDQPAPDANINNLMLKMPVQLFVRGDGNGNRGIAMRVPNCNAISVRAKVEINGVLGWGDNNRIERFAHREIRDSVRTELCKKINDPDEQQRMAGQTAAAIGNLNSALRGAASINVSNIRGDGSIVVSYQLPFSLDSIDRALRNLKMSRSPLPSGAPVGRCGGKLAYTVRFRPQIAGRLEFTVEGANGAKYATWRRGVAANELISMRLERPVNLKHGKLRAIGGKPAVETKTRVKFSYTVGNKTVRGTIPWAKKTLKCGLKRIAKARLTHAYKSQNASTGKGRADVVTTFRSAYAGKLVYQFEGENGALTRKLTRTIKPNRPVKVKVLRTLGGPKSTSEEQNGKRIVRGKSRMHWAIVAHGQTFQGVTRWHGYRMVFPLGPQASGKLASPSSAAVPAAKSRPRKVCPRAGQRARKSRLRNERKVRRNQAAQKRRTKVR